MRQLIFSAVFSLISFIVFAQHDHDHDQKAPAKPAPKTETQTKKSDTTKPAMNMGANKDSQSMDHSTHDHGAMQPQHNMQDHAQHNTSMSHAFSRNLLMTRNGSGTAWMPDNSPLYGYMFTPTNGCTCCTEMRLSVTTNKTC